jgi:hypothetical protein
VHLNQELSRQFVTQSFSAKATKPHRTTFNGSRVTAKIVVLGILLTLDMRGLKKWKFNLKRLLCTHALFLEWHNQRTAYEIKAGGRSGVTADSL